MCDLSDLTSVRRAAAEIIALDLPIAGLPNNAGIMTHRQRTSSLEMRPTKNGLGWDVTFATNYLGPFALTDALAPHLPDGANVLFVASAVEDPGRKSAVRFGFRGGLYISVEANARGEWKPGGSTHPGQDAYATSKQCILAAAMAFARETPRLHFNAIEPGLNLTTGLGGSEVGPFLHFLQRFVIPLLVSLLMPFIKILSTPKQAAHVITSGCRKNVGRRGRWMRARGRRGRRTRRRHQGGLPGRVRGSAECSCAEDNCFRRERARVPGRRRRPARARC
jgi:NAD(P)-dependent dehydrogenase (short-subunit alcohol dehydrogenase family)